jgi:hypothetical protein
MFGFFCISVTFCGMRCSPFRFSGRRSANRACSGAGFVTESIFRLEARSACLVGGYGPWQSEQRSLPPFGNKPGRSRPIELFPGKSSCWFARQEKQFVVLEPCGKRKRVWRPAKQKSGYCRIEARLLSGQMSQTKAIT